MESTPECLPASALKITTPLIANQWEILLRDHPDRDFVHYILWGIRQGFRIGFNREQKCRRANGNMISAIQNPQPVMDFLQAEVAAGRVVGPLPDIRDVQVSRFGVIPKQGQPGKWRLILDWYSPHNVSVNDGVDRELCFMHFATVDNAITKILRLGTESLLAKIDIEHAYRNIPIHPSDRRLLGMMYGRGLYIDTVLPFGLRSAPKVFSAIADAIEWIALHAGVSVLLHYFDDFLTMGQKRLAGMLTQPCPTNTPVQSTGYSVEVAETRRPINGVNFSGSGARHLQAGNVTASGESRGAQTTNCQVDGQKGW